MIKDKDLLQHELNFIGFLIQNKEAIKKISLTKDYLKDFKEGNKLYNFKYIFEKIEDNYKNKNGADLLLDLSKDERIDSNILFDAINSNPYENITSLQEVESIIIEAHKEDLIQKEHTRFKNGELTTNEYTERIEQINKQGITKPTYLTLEDYRKCLEQGNARLKYLGFPKLESLLKLKEHDFIVIGGSTGSGKTALTLNFISELSKHYPCLYFNMEMAQDDIKKRLIAIESGVMLDTIENYEYIKDTDTKRRIDEAIERNLKKRLTLITGSASISTIKGTINKLNPREHTIVFIDHIGLVTIKGSSLYEKTTELVKALRVMALDNDITIFALCQLSRGQTQQGNKAQYNEAPTLNRLKESGEIENSARQVIFIWQRQTDDYYIRIAKNTRGSTNINIPITFTKNTMTIRER